MGAELPLTSTERSARRRAKLRAAGLRPRTFWLPDTSTPDFRNKALRSAGWLWDRATDEAHAMAWIAEMTDDVLRDLDRAEEERRRGPLV